MFRVTRCFGSQRGRHLGPAIICLLVLGCSSAPTASPQDIQDDGGSGVSSEQSDSESLNPNNVTISQPLTIEVFSANDVEDSVTEAILASLNLAANMWGLYWPVEYWVMGLDPEAGEELVDKFCSRREERDEGDEFWACLRTFFAPRPK